MFRYKSRKTVGSVSLKSRSNLTKVTANTPSGNTPFYNERYTGPFESLDSDPVFMEWLPKDQVGLNKMYRMIYNTDSTSGPAVDLFSNLPFSPYALTGVSDKSIMRIYEESCENIDPQTVCPEITREYLVIGRNVNSLIFDSTKGIFTDLVTHDPDYVRITPTPIHKVPPKIDLMPSIDWRQFVSSSDPRDILARQQLPSKMLQQMKRGTFLPLDPESTLLLMRKSSPYDNIGTSFLSRIVPYFALEKHLISGTLVASKRRQRAILHIQAGIDGSWDPTGEEIQSLIDLFMSADADPQGAIVVTRSGVQTNEVRDGNNFWKISEEQDYLNNGKMRAMGVNEAMLSGDASYSTLEAAMSVMVESLKALRGHITNQVFYRKIFPLLARANGFVKRTDAELAHRIRLSKPSVSEASGYRMTDLIMPTIHWEKQLQPISDTNYLDMLDRVHEKGVPIPLKMWAAAAGVSIDEVIAQIPEDIALQKKFRELQGDTNTQDMGGETDSFARYKNLGNEGSKNLGTTESLPPIGHVAGVIKRIESTPVNLVGYPG